MTEAGGATRRGRIGEFLALALLLVVAAWGRLAGFAAPLAGGEALAVDGDSHYHVRRIAGALRGAIPLRDPLVNWPDGAAAPWTDGFDRLGAAFAWVAGGGHPGPGADLAILLWPVVLGVLAVWATVDLARRLAPAGDRATPLAAGLVAAFVPHFVEVSSFGAVDHHVAEALSVLLLLSWTMGRFPVEDESAPGWRWEVAGALVVTFSLWVFIGGQAYVGLAALPLAVAAAWTPGASRLVGSGAPALLGGALLGAVASLPSMAAHGRTFSFTFPSVVQPALVAIAGVALGVVVVSGRLRGEEARCARPACRLLAGAIAGAVLLAAVPPLAREVFRAGHGWLLGRDPWIATIAEFRPLLRRTPTGGLDLQHVRALLGPFGLVALPAIPLGAWVAARRSRERALAFAWAVTVLTALAIFQLRFTRVAAPLLAVTLALALRGVGTLLARVPVAGSLAGAVPLVAVAGIIAASPDLRGLLTYAPLRPLAAIHQVALAIRLDRPPAHGRGDGVLAPWDQGHALLQVSGHPVVANGFGSYLDPASFLEVQEAYRGDEARLVATMQRHDLGIAIGGGHAIAGQLTPPRDEPMLEGDPPVLNLRWMRRTPMSQLLIAGSGLPAAGVPHLERLLPIAVSEGTAGGVSFPLPLVWAYALVPGAQLTGTASPGARVVGEIELREWGRPHRYRAWTVAGPDGRFTLRVAVPSTFAAQAIQTGPAWRITAGEGAPVAVEVPERAVREGLAIAVP